MAKFAPVAVPAHYQVVTGGQASVAVGPVGVREPLAAKYAAAGDCGEFGAGEFFGGWIPHQIDYKGTMFLVVGFHAG